MSIITIGGINQALIIVRFRQIIILLAVMIITI